MKHNWELNSIFWASKEQHKQNVPLCRSLGDRNVLMRNHLHLISLPHICISKHITFFLSHISHFLPLDVGQKPPHIRYRNTTKHGNKQKQVKRHLWYDSTNTSVMAVLICDSHSYNELSTLPRPLTVWAQWRAPCLADPFITRWTQWPCFDSRSWSRTLITWRRDCSHRLLQRKMISARGLILNIHQQFQTLWTFSSHSRTDLKDICSSLRGRGVIMPLSVRDSQNAHKKAKRSMRAI